MPIPTDTFCNIKRLNRVFAVSAVLLLAVTGWAILQDYDQGWRGPQRSGKVWEAALVDEKITQELTADKTARLAELDKEIESKRQELEKKDKERPKLVAQIRQFESDQSKMEFEYNTLKANVGVEEGKLQDAITAGD